VLLSALSFGVGATVTAPWLPIVAVKPAGMLTDWPSGVRTVMEQPLQSLLAVVSLVPGS
jgi:hypothetical protein